KVHFINMVPPKRTHKADLNIRREILAMTWLRSPLPILGTDRQLHLKDRALAQRGLHPDTTTVHLDDLSGDGETEASATLGLGERAVDLMELLKDARLFRGRNARPRVRHAYGKVAIDGLSGDAYLANIGELDGVADEVEEDLGEALLVA